MIKCAFYLVPDGKRLDQLSREQIRDFLATGEGLLWVDIEDATDEDAKLLSNELCSIPLRWQTVSARTYIHPR